MHNQKVDKEKIKKSLERLYSIYSEMSYVADKVMQSRCPYKNAKSRCTALFNCRNQSIVKSGDLPVCTGSDKLDYRSAWESSAK